MKFHAPGREQKSSTMRKMSKEEKHEHAQPQTKKSSPKKRRRRIILLSIVVILIAFRLVLPYIVLHYVNKKLSQLKEYYGHVDDINIAIIRGAYVIKGLKLDRIETDKKDSIPFFSSPTIDLSVQWSALFKGSVVGEIYVDAPVLNFVKGKHKEEDVKADTADFRWIIKKLMPLKVNHFEITRGQIHYIDNTRSPALDVFMRDVQAVATNLSNVNDSNTVLPARLVASGHVYDGDFKMNVSFDALNKVPTFDMNAELTTMDLTQVNPMLRAYGNFEVQQGRFGLYTEFAAKQGQFGGYVKPVIKDMKVRQLEGDAKQVLWEMLIGSAAKLLENKSEEQVATKVEINGRFDDPSINLWAAVSYVLRNAFVHALKPSIDNSINIKHLEENRDKTVLEKIFGSKKKIKDKNKK